jgi:TATA-box binding protein (TBP) (component of TFIID and TFIIIB)
MSRVTTITAIVDINFTIDIEKLLYFIPVNRGYREIREGDIISLRYKGSFEYCKSLIDVKRKPFRNSITLSIVCKDKIASAKIFKRKVQICGADSDETIRFCMDTIMDHIRKIEECPMTLNVYTLSFINNFGYSDNRLKCNLELRDIINSLVEYKKCIHCIDNSSNTLSYNINKVMINYKYDLNLEISKNNLIDVLSSDEKRRFLIIPQSLTDFYFYIYIMIFDNHGEFASYLIVYKSGKITQSGKNHEKMNEAFNIFYDIVMKNRDKIFTNPKRRVIFKQYIDN